MTGAGPIRSGKPVPTGRATLWKLNHVNPQESLPSAEPNPCLGPGNNCWTPERLELKAWLERNAASLAELYEGAIHILFENRTPGYTRFVGHAVREIRNRLPFVISGSTSAEQLQYKNRLDTIVEICNQSGFPTDGTLPVASVSNSPEPEPTNCSLPLELARSIAELISDHEKARERPWDAAKRLFIGLRPENQRFVDTLRPAITQWLGNNLPVAGTTALFEYRPGKSPNLGRPYELDLHDTPKLPWHELCQ